MYRLLSIQHAIQFYFIPSFSFPWSFQIRHLLDGDHFGEIALVTTNRRIAFVVAVEPCELYKLERKDFIHAILPYPDLLVKIERIAFERIEETSNLEGRTAWNIINSVCK